MLSYTVRRFLVGVNPTPGVNMLKFLPALVTALLTITASSAFATDTNDEAICYAAGIGAGNIAGYKEQVFDKDPKDVWMAIVMAKSSLARQPRHLQQKVNLMVVNAASMKSWPSVQAALNEFGKLCPCGGQSPCGTVMTNPVKVN